MKPIICTWSPELEDLRQYHDVFPAEQFPTLVPELTSLGEMTQGIDTLNRARRLLEIIVIDLCKTDLQRERGTEPLKGILDRFAKDKVIPECVISSMYNVNELGKYGSHPKDFDEQRQVREALLSPVTVLHWYAQHRGLSLPARYSNAIIEQEMRSYELEMVGGAIPLNSKFYVQRPVDQEFQAAIARRDTIILLKGAWQVSKTSLLARGLQQARENNVYVLLTDFQKLIPNQLQSLENLFLALGEMLADQLNLDVYPQDKWRPGREPNMNFDSYFRREILSKRRLE